MMYMWRANRMEDDIFSAAVDTYPACINFYVNDYKEMWEKTEF